MTTEELKKKKKKEKRERPKLTASAPFVSSGRGMQGR